MTTQMSSREFNPLVGKHRVLDLLVEPAGVEDIELTIPESSELAQPAAFD